MVIVLRLPNLKKLTKLPLSPTKSLDGIDINTEDSNAASHPMGSRIITPDNSFTTLHTLAEAAAVVEATSPVSSELTPLNSPEPETNETEDSSPPKIAGESHMISGASKAVGSRKVNGKRKAIGPRRPVGRPPKKQRTVSKKEA
ncbi:hypothetical protein K440DRAFT_611502 [Wilcoxina mikolae CBS 423.85]|nr:hypothetical protein K440DRAFT_611502 [Wilcoxina mikolae CBS 423.85]